MAGGPWKKHVLVARFKWVWLDMLSGSKVMTNRSQLYRKNDLSYEVTFCIFAYGKESIEVTNLFNHFQVAVVKYTQSGSEG